MATNIQLYTVKWFPCSSRWPIEIMLWYTQRMKNIHKCVSWILAVLFWCTVCFECQRNVGFLLLNLEEVVIMFLFCHFFLSLNHGKLLDWRIVIRLSPRFGTDSGKSWEVGKWGFRDKTTRKETPSLASFKEFKRERWCEGNFNRNKILGCHNST